MTLSRSARSETLNGEPKPLGLPHRDDHHLKVQQMCDDLNRWFDSPTGQAFKKHTEEIKMPDLALHLLYDTAFGDPDLFPQTCFTLVMLGAEEMRKWMEKRQAEVANESGGER